MSIYALTEVRCDDADCLAYEHIETANLQMGQAVVERMGWSRKLVGNDRVLDLCPRHGNAA